MDKKELFEAIRNGGIVEGRQLLGSDGVVDTRHQNFLLAGAVLSLAYEEKIARLAIEAMDFAEEFFERRRNEQAAMEVFCKRYGEDYGKLERELYVLRETDGALKGNLVKSFVTDVYNSWDGKSDPMKLYGGFLEARVMSEE